MKKLIFYLTLYFKSIIISLSIMLSFFLGMKFANFGVIDKVVPIVINYTRNNLLGDFFVLKMEKTIFSFNDFLKSSFQIRLSDRTSNQIDHDYNKLVLDISEAYLKDPNKFKESDYRSLFNLLNNFYPNMETVYKNKEKGEGFWEKFLLSPETFRPLYAKTFLRPDIDRNYAKMHIYKFDMDRLSLDFIPGKDDSDDVDCDGKMDEVHRKKVFWVFSGGYQYRHGSYGMKYKEKILLPPKIGAQTLFFYKNGTYKLKEWTRYMKDDENAYAFRQNELPLIINGKITPKIDRMWGRTPDDVDPIYTVRSGLGFTKNNELVFAFGENLSAETLAIGMLKAGVINGMHLDMNYYNVHLVNVTRSLDGRLVTKNENNSLSFYKNIYAFNSPRDYFILTVKDVPKRK